MPAESSAIPHGRSPVEAHVAVESPLGAIFDTVFARSLAVYTLPAESTAIAYGPVPVVPRIVETPLGVIFDTLFES